MIHIKFKRAAETAAELPYPVVTFLDSNYGVKDVSVDLHNNVIEIDVAQEGLQKLANWNPRTRATLDLGYEARIKELEAKLDASNKQGAFDRLENMKLRDRLAQVKTAVRDV